MAESRIEWTELVWNPVTGCTPVSRGCEHCYARRMATRLAGRYGYPQDHPFAVTLHPDRLTEPLRRRKPTTYFVCSMGDLFHDEVPDEFIDQVWAVMAACPQHTFQVLTKRPERMLSCLTGLGASCAACLEHWESANERADLYPRTTTLDSVHDDPRCHRWYEAAGELYGVIPHAGQRLLINVRWPLPNVWLGVSVEDQQTADERIPLLLKCPAAVRFVSCEPLLGPVDASVHLPCTRGVEKCFPDGLPPGGCCECSAGRRGIDWVIVGGETGPGARPMHPDWPRGLRDQCDAAGVPFFFKSWGAWCPQDHLPDGVQGSRYEYPWNYHQWDYLTTYRSVRVGSSRSGRLLDGVLHDAMPEVAK